MEAAAATTAPTLLEAMASTDLQLADAAPAAPVAPATSVTRYVRFTVAATCYAVRQDLVLELDRVPKITMVPQVPAWLRGITNLRGDVLSVIDLRTFMGLEATRMHGARMLVVRLLDEEFSVGLLVDAIDDIVTLAAGDIQPPASALDGPLAPFLIGMCQAADRLVAVLDLERLLHSPDIRQFDDVEHAETA